MEILQIILLSIIQGLTEFLPVSSSAHLILFSQLFSNFDDQGVAYDAVMHLGTLLASLYFLRRELFGNMLTQRAGESYKQALCIGSYMLISVLPLVLVGLLLNIPDHSQLRSLPVIAISNLFFACLMLLAMLMHNHSDGSGSNKTNAATSFSIESINTFTFKIALLFLCFGFIQSLAVIPGASRSGLIITLALLLQIRLPHAVFIAFLTAIPSIAGSVLWVGIHSTHWDYDILLAMIALLFSGTIGYLAMGWFGRAINKWALLPFVIYRLLLSAAIGLIYLLQ